MSHRELELEQERNSALAAVRTAVRIGERLQAQVDRYESALEEIAALKGQAAGIARDALGQP